ncbi:hypothetical protein ACFXDJ_04095 [Streptomyces sp. NPDC059443]|uniref:hypothetical protein n=1 Tax=unclassified Streptomyces TaxID=2593676 RepID=UPI0036CB7FDA
MLNDLWKGMSGKLSERWLTALFSPACLFWLAGLACWVRSEGGGTVRAHGWRAAAKMWTTELAALPALAQAMAAVGVLLLLTLSGLLLRFLSRPIVRCLEGYWAFPAPRRWLRERLGRRAERDIAQLRPLAARAVDSLDAEVLAQRARLIRRVRAVPLDPRRRMPTRLGNVLRASEDRVRAHYGLDPVICWPRLWLLLPDTVKEEVLAAHRSLLVVIHVGAVWVACTVWSVWSLWAIPISLLAATVTYYGFLLAAAAAHAELVESCFDLYRQQLYTSLRWPLPRDPLTEYEAGRHLTAYLATGSRRPEPVFSPPEG